MTLLDQVKHFFEADDWRYTETELGLNVTFGGQSGEWECLALVRESRGQFLFFSLFPVKVPAAQYAGMAEFLMRANFGLYIGNFEIDFDSGTVHYRTSVDVEDDAAALSFPVIKNLVYQNVLTMDKYLPGLLAVLQGRRSPADAIDLIEDD